MKPSNTTLLVGSVILAIAGIAFVLYGVAFFMLNFLGQLLEIGIGPDQVNVSKSQIQQFSPQLLHYISHLNVALAGVISALGLALTSLSWFAVRKAQLWAWWTVVITLAFALAISIPLHFTYHFVTLLHLGPIFLAAAIWAAGAIISIIGMSSERVR